MLAITGGTPPYQTWWSDGVEGPVVRDELPEGIYAVPVTDAFACPIEGVFEIQGGLTSKDTEVDAIVLIPNPARNTLEVKGTAGDVHIRIFDISGKQVAQWPQNAHVGSVAELRPGMYFLEPSPQSPVRKRFVKTD